MESSSLLQDKRRGEVELVLRVLAKQDPAFFALPRSFHTQAYVGIFGVPAEISDTLE